MLRTTGLLLVLAASAAAQSDITGRPPDLARPDGDSAAATPEKDTRPAATLRFDLEFEHRLTNKTRTVLKSIRIYVPVPEDCYQQKVSNLVWLRGGQEAKVAIKKDQYGQRVASFFWPKLPAGDSLVVGFKCRAALRKPPKAKLADLTSDDIQKIPAAVRAVYTKDVGRVYGLGSPLIHKKARELAAGRKRLAERVRAIYDFVAEDLTYKREGGWDPAPKVLTRKSGSCSEFSYLFSSLCRANGIPTRFVGATMLRLKEVEAYPYVDKVWHRWVQVYLPDTGWVHMDPTRDRGKKARHEFFGRQPGPALVLSHHGGSSKYLGNHYVSADNQSSKQVKRARKFSWMPVAATTPLPRQSPQR
ncbi:MAG: transglutaminase-like domain-containing protein [Planctomycetota bacterium]|jgi:transglutaminase-like putative cysteine protease